VIQWVFCDDEESEVTADDYINKPFWDSEYVEKKE